MALVLTNGPTGEPVTLSDAKDFLRVSTSEEDMLISSLITAARVHVEVSLNRCLMTQSWSYFLDVWPEAGELKLPLAPLQSVTQIRIFDASETATVFSSANYVVDAKSEIPRIVLKNGAVWPVPEKPVNGIEIEFVAGYSNSASSVPETIRQALRQMVTHWYEKREPVILGQTSFEVPQMITSLLAPYKRVRII